MSMAKPTWACHGHGRGHRPGHGQEHGHGQGQGAQTKRPETKRPWTKRPLGQNVRGDKTSVATKRPSEKTSVGTKRPLDKTSGGQNVRGDKTSVGTKRPWGQNVRLGHIYQGLARQYFLLIKIYWAWRRKNPPIPTLSLCGRACTVLSNTERSFIVIKTVYILTMWHY
jgi:hypothetical protein